jgi:hypothetical protein
MQAIKVLARIFPGWSLRDLAEAVGISFDFVLAYPARECLPLKCVASNRVRRAPRQAHPVFAFRADRVIGRAKTGWHGEFLWVGEGINPPSELAFQWNCNYSGNRLWNPEKWLHTLPESASLFAEEPASGAGSALW